MHKMTPEDAIKAINNLNKGMKDHYIHLERKGNMMNLFLNGSLIHGTSNPDCFVSYVCGLIVGRMAGLNEAERNAS